MALQLPKAAILSKTMRFLTAGGLTLAIAVAQEATKSEPDWGLIATMLTGILVGIGGGAYGRCVAKGPVTSVLATSDRGRKR
ncbi:MAG: hypothetical protein SGJ21_04365 [Alphaproteobacteria bacterium]|nr:hypothetical protein [Alphaproteobacteria bacterium]